MRLHLTAIGMRPNPSPGRAENRLGGLGAMPPAALIAGSWLSALFLGASVRLWLPRYFPGPGVSVDFTFMLGPDWKRVSGLYIAFVLVAFALYGVAVWSLRRVMLSLPVLAVFPVLFIAALLPMYPPTAVDIFHYQADARTLAIHHQNPLIVAPEVNPYAIGISWAEQPSPYGPAWSLVAAPIAFVTGDHYIAGLLLFKALAGLTLLGCAALIWRIVRRTRPGAETLAVVLFAWNPAILVRVVGNGHNDLLMMFFALLALERAERQHWVAMWPALALSVLVKYVTALLGPMLLLYAWGHTEGTPRERVRALLPGLGLAGLVTVLCYAPFWAGLDTFKTVAGENRKVITSLSLLVQERLVTVMTPDDAASLARTITRAVFAALYLPLVWQARRDFPRLVACAANALFLYLVVASGWFRPWYLLWPLTLAALLPRTWFTVLFLALSFCACFPDLIEQYRNNMEFFAPYFRAIAAPVMVTVWVPLTLWYFGLLYFRSWHFNAPRPVAREARS